MKNVSTPFNEVQLPKSFYVIRKTMVESCRKINRSIQKIAVKNQKEKDIEKGNRLTLRAEN